MRRPLSWMIVVLVCAAHGRARGADCPAESTEQRAARRAYEEAVVAEGKGDYGGARKKLERVVAEYPASPFACWARTKLAVLTSGKAPINKNGRAQFIIGSTLFAAWTVEGIALIAMLDDEDISDSEGKGLIWAGLGGAAAGLLPSIFFSSNLPMSTGRATTINFGWSWGLWHGLAISLLPDDLDDQVIIGSALGGSVAGWLGTFIATHYLDVADGDAAVVASSAYWGSWLSFMIGGLIGGEPFFEEKTAIIPTILGGGDAGLVTAALLSPRLDISAGRVGLINLGGLLGAMLAGGIIAVAELDDPRPALGIGLGTVSAGLVLTTWLTRNYDRPDTGASGLALIERTTAGKWVISPPPPRIGASHAGWSMTLPLVGGQL